MFLFLLCDKVLNLKGPYGLRGDQALLLRFSSQPTSPSTLLQPLAFSASPHALGDDFASYFAEEIKAIYRDPLNFSLLSSYPHPPSPPAAVGEGSLLEWPPAPPCSVATLPPCHLRNHVLLSIISLSCIFHRSISTRSFLPVFTHPQVFSIFISNKQTKTNSHLPQASLSLLLHRVTSGKSSLYFLSLFPHLLPSL